MSKCKIAVFNKQKYNIIYQSYLSEKKKLCSSYFDMFKPYSYYDCKHLQS